MQQGTTVLPAERRPRALFVGRRGILLATEDDSRCFESAVFQPRVLELLFRASRGGWRIYVIGNVDDVARGASSDAAWKEFEIELLGRLRAEGITVARHYACVDRPDGQGKHRRDSVFLFPNTGAFYHAAQHDGIDLDESWLVSGDVFELAAGWRASVHVAALDPTGSLRANDLQVEPDIVGGSAGDLLADVLAIGRATRV